MADGIVIPVTGTGDATPTVATDDTGATGHVQIVKLAISANGSVTLLPSDAANGLDVDVTRVDGGVDSGTADSGGPVKVGGRFNGTRPTLTTGQRGDIQLDNRGNLATVLYGENATSAVAVNNNADGQSASLNRLYVNAINYAYNGATFDRLRTPNVFKPITPLAVGAEATVWTPAAGKKFRLMGMVISATNGAQLTFRDNTGGTTIFIVRVLANGAVVIGADALGNSGILSAAANNVLTCQSDVATNLVGTIFGTEE